ncbi:D-alanyl-D-alanine carboxypeptidase/D-alanyl-D-alanine-endopeptidase [Actinacidiphila sp. DG2A-62]|uniref:D-alanyl-D-alanine carboxypeptidase/D-alanyl-D-alanine endopeptidase n=1 Tax=Actinacidiphila sp. DG2A-62 TaxID=3108821 RepID=UPI002DB91F4B|nr:D-alanyl-D-alanine carboxypeptidase/D-alanyl-D-alanine-endopeptidase [Actinacidiphila sp. DG2A-62]MEC3994809.1 D-alanyl-D-alanine carboxypeptidase/D-alanyl-D-alanine-endopeptidase [Actinacidiphila sp. DG2A-62]
MPLGRTWQVAAGSAAIGLAVAAGTAVAAGPWESGRRTAERTRAAALDRQRHPAPAAPAATAAPPPPLAAQVLAPVPAAAAPATGGSGPSAALPAALTARLDQLMAAPGLGHAPTGAVTDVASGRLLYGHGADTPGTPASVTKLATAVAALTALGPEHRLTTTVVRTAPDRVVLVGGGDPTLELTGLAADTAAALKAAGTTSVTLAYDTSYFAGPAQHPIGPNENLALVTALMVREGRLDGSSSGPATRADDPAKAAAVRFAALLRRHGVTVRGTPAPGSGKGGARLAAHGSAPLADLVERMLTNSDNDLAEALVRQTALATGRPATFAGGAAAVRAELARYGVPLTGAVFTDGSGLARADRLSPRTLAALLALAASPAHPQLRPVLTGLPVAAFTGTLTSRFTGGPGAGLVRAKTGTLTGVNTVAGTVLTRSGRLLAFSFMADDASSPADAQAALDALATALARS